jgi:hypothetical protein
MNINCYLIKRINDIVAGIRCSVTIPPQGINEAKIVRYARAWSATGTDFPFTIPYILVAIIKELKSTLCK